ncbi:pentapeptide repeat-containing protein [Streptomyces sp. NPDC050535]|uniref:pentapeptide repeat-containing protein n=1 Tax=Streptomyces sp. NPDC050535 TaxID=3365626 RepID=UPI0037A23B11
MTANQRPRSTPNDRELRLWEVGRALTLVFAAAVLFAGGIFYGLVKLLDFKEIDSTSKLDAETLFDLVKLSFGVVAGAGALVALVVAYRRQRVDEAGAHREATRLHTERFSQAVDKLGSDSPAVRLGGVHALAGLADDAPTQDLRQTCVDVLCAYLRLPFPRHPGAPPAVTSSEEVRESHQDKKDRYLALRQVRHTILRLIGDHYRVPEGDHRSWQGCNLDLIGVSIDGSMDFRGAVFSRGTVNFADAVFSDGLVDFSGAVFSSGRTVFQRAVFSGALVNFDKAVFSGGTVNFSRAVFSRNRVLFRDAVFSGCTMDFSGAVFSGGRVVFSDTTFSRGTANFMRTEFSGGWVDFGEAEFSGGTVNFRQAEFSGGTVNFSEATFSSGTADFWMTEFSGGRVVFIEATFSGSTVDFSDATGSAPESLLDAIGTPVPAEVVLPPGWIPPMS